MDTEEEANKETTVEETKPTSLFKKPVLVGKIGQLPRKIVAIKAITEDDKTIPNEIQEPYEETKDSQPSIPESITNIQPKPLKAPAQQLMEKSLPLPYKEPNWSGLPSTRNKEYIVEVLKSGVIVQQINLMAKPFWVFGRSPNCEIYMAHPTVSRYHAVLQYRQEGTEENPRGFYIYDLNSTHGTFLNKGQLKPRVYAPVKVGHMIRLGLSTRCFILTGPDEDTEEESEFSVTELKQQRVDKLLKQELAEKEALLREQQVKEEQRKRDEERGIDWGLGEDADEETDLSENPYAQTNNEELYLDDPKKALRGFMEREGYDLDYDCTEQGFGQFFCKVELPIDDDRGRPIVAEVIHKGKKKEAVVQCALEACRILDRYGVLRQATHESRKRKAKNWEENDYYDSDDDTFLDRTGAIEKKREKRMQSKVPQQPETYQSLLEKEKTVSEKITEIEQQLSSAKTALSNKSGSAEEDPLDSFMKELKQPKPDKQTISKLKSDLATLKVEHTNIVKLVNIAKPADLPPLVVSSKNSSEQGPSGSAKAKVFPLFGKRPKIKVLLPLKPSMQGTREKMNVDEEEEEDENEETVNKVEEESELSVSTELSLEIQNSSMVEINSGLNDQNFLSSENSSTVNNRNVEKQSDNVGDPLQVYLKIAEMQKSMSENKFSPILEPSVTAVRDVVEDVLQKVKDLSQRDILKERYDDLQFVRICKEFQRVCVAIREMSQKQQKIYYKFQIFGAQLDLMIKEILQIGSESKGKKDGEPGESTKEVEAFKAVSKPLDGDLLHSEDDEEENDKDDDKHLTPEELEKRKKKNQRRLQHRRERAEMEKQKGYREDAQKQDYNMWVPPKDQSGDGRTSLNEKYGY